VLDPGALLEDFDTLAKNGIGFRNRLYLSDRANIVTALHKSIANKIRSVRHDQVWLTGEDVTHSFKPLKMGLRMSHLTDDWKSFEDKYLRVLKTCGSLYSVEVGADDIA